MGAIEDYHRNVSGPRQWCNREHHPENGIDQRQHDCDDARDQKEPDRDVSTFAWGHSQGRPVVVDIELPDCPGRNKGGYRTPRRAEFRPEVINLEAEHIERDSKEEG